MTIDDQLRSVLHGHAESVVDDHLPGRSAATIARARQLRTRQVAAVGSGVAAVVTVVAVAALGANPFERADDVAPAGPPPTIQVVESFAGRTLIDATEVADGAPLTWSVDAPRGSDWRVTCTGVGPEYVAHLRVGDEPAREGACATDAVAGDTMGFRYSAAEPAGQVEVRLWLTRGGGSTPVEPVGATLGVAVYELPTPYGVLAGLEVMPLERHEGRDWQVAAMDESVVGEQKLAVTYPALSEDSILEVIALGSRTQEVRLFIDGRRQSTVPAVYTLGTVNIGDVVPAGGPHEVVLRIVGDPPADAQLALVRRTWTGESS